MTLSEDNFYNKLFSKLPPFTEEIAVPPGDDCAAITAGNGLLTLYTTDQVVADIHYLKSRQPPVSPQTIAHKLLARNLSDIAAMGGNPTYCLASIVQQDGEPWLDSFFDGLLQTAEKYNVFLIGGDIVSAANYESSSLTLIGTVAEKNVCTRKGAEAGDILFATGEFGQSLQTDHHLNFQPRCEEGQWLAQHSYPNAMIDVSDGLLLDAYRMCCASDVSLQLDTTAIPFRNARTTLKQALTDGEDYELLFSVPPHKAKTLEKSWPFDTVPLTKIGTFSKKSKEGARITDPEKHELAPADELGYEQKI